MLSFTGSAYIYLIVSSASHTKPYRDINFISDISWSPTCKQHCSFWATYLSTRASPGALAVFHKCLMWLWCIVWPKTRKLASPANTCQRGRFQVNAVLPPPAEPGRVPGLAKLGIWTPNNAIWGQPSRTQTQKPIAVNLWCRVKRWRSASFPDGGVGTARGFKLLAVLHKDEFSKAHGCLSEGKRADKWIMLNEWISEWKKT